MMEDSNDFDARVFHTPLEHSGSLSEEKRISRPATPFARRKTRKLYEQDGEPRALFNSVSSKTFLSSVLFLKLVLVAFISHNILSDTAEHLQEMKEYHNPTIVLVPVSAICIFLAMVALGTNRPLLFIPYLLVQFGSWVLTALVCSAVSWHHHREFFTRREFGIAVASFVLPLWIWSYITFVAFRVFFSMIHQQKLHRLEKNRHPEHGLLVQEEDVIVFEKPSTVRHASESNKKRVRFTDILGKH